MRVSFPRGAVLKFLKSLVRPGAGLSEGEADTDTSLAPPDQVCATGAPPFDLGIDLGAAVCALLELDPAPGWSPRPETWPGEPEKGAF